MDECAAGSAPFWKLILYDKKEICPSENEPRLYKKQGRNCILMKLDLVLCLATAAYAAPTLRVKDTVVKSLKRVGQEVQDSLDKWDRSVDVFMSNNVGRRLPGRGDVARRVQEKWTPREAAVLAAFYGTAVTGGVVGAGIIQSAKAKQEHARYVELAKSRSTPSTPSPPTETPITEETPITPAEIPLNE